MAVFEGEFGAVRMDWVVLVIVAISLVPVPWYAGSVMVDFGAQLSNDQLFSVRHIFMPIPFV